jgi:hypothetical protein
MAFLSEAWEYKEKVHRNGGGWGEGLKEAKSRIRTSKRGQMRAPERQCYHGQPHWSPDNQGEAKGGFPSLELSIAPSQIYHVKSLVEEGLCQREKV